MNEQEIESFWREKEKKYQSTLVKASAAQYITGYPMVQGPINGLLYIMKNGIYFENFQQDHWLDKVFRVKNNFTPVSFCLKNEYITDVSCYPGQKNKFRIQFGKRLALFFGLLPQHLTVGYKQGGETILIRFAPAENLLSLCSAYHRECRKAGPLESK
ncbi:MAG: hypothetical protein JW904_05940 [Spirochaetales bacterium]|nr:hypothetical protein [Spirochaetales bacterium]